VSVGSTAVSDSVTTYLPTIAAQVKINKSKHN